MSRAYRNYDNEIIIKPDLYGTSIGLITLIFTISVGIFVIIGMMPFDAEHSLVNIIGLIFICIWMCLGIIMGTHTIIFNHSQIIINLDGITHRNLFSEYQIKWNELADYGISYWGRYGRSYNSMTYYLYFSKKPLKTKNRSRKLIKGKMIKAFVYESDFDSLTNWIFPFCRSQTELEPFIGQKTHWWENG